MQRFETTARLLNHASPDCWVDIFDADYFMGRRKRIQGPRKLTQLQAKSLIVGPEAVVVLSLGRAGRKKVVRLKARRVVPDLAKSLGGAKFREALLEFAK
jgi:hypothetical protein